ncbi:MAG TPA: DNA repair protein RadA [bacterium]|nr:DNA repair protein RadA [bacterium]HPV65476.1 DNA repair protein RadA [bacterium]
MISKIKTIFECQNCGAQFPKWSGRCLECGNWGTLVESLSDDKKKNEKTIIDKISSADVVNLEDVSNFQSERFKTGVFELDRVLGGGLIQGSLILLSGEPGVGKSTLLAQISDSIVKNNKSFAKVLYISGEESAGQVKLRLERLKCNLKSFNFVSETNLEKIISTAIKNKPDLLIADSIQTIYSSLVPSEAGGVSQIRTIAVKFMELAKKYNIPVFLIGHITKDGQVAGPKSLEHIVDVVLSLENDNRGAYSILRSSKNRFGSVNEIGVLEMTGSGFEEVKNASSVFLDNDLSHSFPGSSFSCVVEGNRPFLINVQALVSRTVFGYPQRKSSGFDLNRLQVLSAVISKKQKLDLTNQDIILNIVGGLRASDPALDLAVSLSIISSYLNQEVIGKMAILGELGLGGELRPISYLDMRLREIEKMGFSDVLLSGSLTETEKEKIKNNFKKLKFIFVKNLSEAIKSVFSIKNK